MQLDRLTWQIPVAGPSLSLRDIRFARCVAVISGHRDQAAG